MSKRAGYFVGFLAMLLSVPSAFADTGRVYIFAENNAICLKKPDRGPCKGLFESYYFDAASHSCKMFIWGGCQGSVPFRTLDECQKACTPSSPKQPNK